MRKSRDTGSSGKTEVPEVGGEEEEAIRKLRVALQNPHGTSTENRGQVISAWGTLRSVATSPALKIKVEKRHRKRSKLEAKKKNSKKILVDDAEALRGDTIREKDQILHEAAQMGQPDRVRELISLGSKVSSRDTSGYSALHWASLYGHVEVVKVLLGLGAGDGKRIDRQNNAGNTALHLACIGRHAQVAAILQVYKPDEYLLNSYEQSPVSLGLRKLIERVEKMQRLDDIEAARVNSRQRLSLDYSDWGMGASTESAQTSANDVQWNNGISKRDPRGLWASWEDYDAGWKKFAERFMRISGTEEVAKCSKNSVTESVGVGASGSDMIRFQDVPWPVTGMHLLTGSHTNGDGTQDKERLLLAELGITGVALRSLIQHERFRWHPDKFEQLFSSHLLLAEKSAILAGVQTVCQLLNSLAEKTDELSEDR